MIRILLAATLLVSACAAPAGQPAPGRSTVHGSLRLVPREGVTPGGAGGSPYASRALRDVEFVDYAHPGFAVVYLDGRTAPAGSAELAIRATRVHTRLEPAALALGAGGTLRVRNASGEPHVVSVPGAGRVQKLAPGDALELALDAGRHAVFLLDVPDGEATVFAAPGPFAVVSEDGRWEIRDVEPGRVRVVAWHARFPGTAAWLDLAEGRASALDFAIGVGREEAADAGR